MPKKPKTELAGRLKQTAHSAGFTAEALAEVLGSSPAAVWAWWSGRNEPGVETLVAYAKAVGTTIHYLATGELESTADPEGFAEWVMRFADAVMGGGDPGAAYDAVTGMPSVLSDRERRSLGRRAQAMRAAIEQQAGRPWADLPEEERRLIVQELIRDADP